MLGVKLAVSLAVVSCCDKQEKKQHATRSMRHRPTADPTVERGGLAGAGGRSEDTGTGTGTGGGRRANIGVKRVCGQVGGRRQRAQGGLGARRHVVWRRGTRRRSRRSTGDGRPVAGVESEAKPAGRNGNVVSQGLGRGPMWTPENPATFPSINHQTIRQRAATATPQHASADSGAHVA
jgi:hypothetical protein